MFEVHNNASWWPTPLQHIPAMDFLRDDMVTVAELSNGESSDSTRNFYMALIEPNVGRELLENNGLPMSCCPSLGLFLEGVACEPLVIRWEGKANQTVQVPSERFLKEFTLVPRPVDSVLIWDNLAVPQHDVVRAQMLSHYDFPNIQTAKIEIKRDYLLKYADKTNRAIIVLWYERNTGENKNEIGQPYGDEEFGDFQLPGRLFGMRKNGGQIDAEFWGALLVYEPSSSIIEDVALLNWPGISDPVTPRSALKLGMQLVYIKDSVLDFYEEHPERYQVHPESGAISYKNQWGVSYCHRVGRNLVEIEIKKLYEGAPMEVITHWHKHAVLPPTRIPYREPNIGTRARRIVEELLNLGDALSTLYTLTTNTACSPIGLIGLDRNQLERTWWYDHKDVRPITRRIALDMGRDSFLDRCEFLEKLVIESIKKGEQDLRTLLTSWGVNSKKIEPLRSLKLLDRVLQYVFIANESGLSIKQNFPAIEERYLEKISSLPEGKFLESPVTFFFVLYDIRNLAAHPSSSDNELLELLGITNAHITSGWGRQLDNVYDQVGDSLASASQMILANCPRRG